MTASNGSSEALFREVENLKELLGQRLEAQSAVQNASIDGQIKVVTQRLDDIDKATALLDETVHRVPTDIQTAIKHLRELDDERFGSVQTQFTERDTRQERESRDNKLAVDAAFAAQEKQQVATSEATAEAQAKSEAGTKELIEKLQDLLAANTAATGVQIGDVKERISHEAAAAERGRGELASRVTALEQQKVGAKEDRTSLIAGISILITTAVFAVGFAAFLAAHH